MTTIEYRKMDFRFDDDIPFQFHPGNITVSDAVNALTITAPAFEPYFIKAFRDAMPLIRDERLKEETRLFIQQEAQHSRHHIAHLNMLLRMFPELEQLRDETNASYHRLYETQPLKFHLAYTATVELAFGPIARFIIENRHALFSGGDARISSFVLWHFVEEFEHRNCAIDVYNAVVGSPLYRLSQVRATMRHLHDNAMRVRRVFRRMADEGKIAMPDEHDLDCVPARSWRRLRWDLLGTLLPWHNPSYLREPAWATQWLADHRAGKSMTQAYTPSN